METAPDSEPGQEKYMNSKRYSSADYRESYELKPMLDDEATKKDLRVELDGAEVKTSAVGPRKGPEKSPTGSSSSNSSYTSTDGYLLPVVRKPTQHSRRMVNSLKSSTGSTTSDASSGFHSDYANEEYTPPEYSRTVEMTMV